MNFINYYILNNLNFILKIPIYIEKVVEKFTEVDKPVYIEKEVIVDRVVEKEVLV